jgi:hypothetical protein
VPERALRRVVSVRGRRRLHYFKTKFAVRQNAYGGMNNFSRILTTPSLAMENAPAISYLAMPAHAAHEFQNNDFKTWWAVGMPNAYTY